MKNADKLILKAAPGEGHATLIRGGTSYSIAQPHAKGVIFYDVDFNEIGRQRFTNSFKVPEKCAVVKFLPPI